MKKIISVFLVLGFVVSVIGCGGLEIREGEQKVVETSHKSAPKWLVQIPKAEEGLLYFRGMRTGAITKEAGLIDSRMDAARQVSEAIKMDVETEYTTARDEKGFPADDKDIGWVLHDTVGIISKAEVTGLKEAEIYWEKIETMKDRKISYLYNVYQLVSISQDVYKTLSTGPVQEQIRKAQEAKNKKAEELAENMINRLRAK